MATARAGVDRLQYERVTVAPFVGQFGWRTLLNALWPLGAWAGVVWAYRTDRLPLWAAFVLAAVALQAFYMPVHESVHATISAGRPKWSWLDRIVGSVCGWMMCQSFVEHRYSHLAHHTHANTAGDPDVLNAKGRLRDIFVRVLMGGVLYVLAPVLALLGLARVVPASIRERAGQMAQIRGPEASRAGRLVALSHIVVLVVATVLGFGVEVWLLWYVPVWIGRIWLSAVFGWLPHDPHDEIGRYRDTRVFTFVGSTFLIRGHDYHLLHHLFPRVPHYRLASLWKQLGPHLVEQGARIEGRAARQLGIEPQ